MLRQVVHVVTRGAQIPRNLGATSKSWVQKGDISKLYTEDPQILGTTVQNLIMIATL
jgi:hypothetical protein